jgi:thiol-disulfide isomerase/thioredoxin
MPIFKRLISAFALILAASSLMPASGAQELRKAPELAFTVPGQGEKLLSQYRGKVVALAFILTTCPHCQAYTRTMTGLEQQYGPQGLQAIDVAINALDDNRTPDQAGQMVQTFINTFRPNFPIGFVPRDSFLSFLGLSIAEYTVVPQVVLIDRKGYIHYQTPARGDGISTEEGTLRSRIQELLALPVSASQHSAPKVRASR